MKYVKSKALRCWRFPGLHALQVGVARRKLRMARWQDQLGPSRDFPNHQRRLGRGRPGFHDIAKDSFMVIICWIYIYRERECVFKKCVITYRIAHTLECWVFGWKRRSVTCIWGKATVLCSDIMNATVLESYPLDHWYDSDNIGWYWKSYLWWNLVSRLWWSRLGTSWHPVVSTLDCCEVQNKGPMSSFLFFSDYR